MKGILADINIEGHIRDLIETFYTSEEWSVFWNHLGIESLTFPEIGLAADTADDIVWQTCQDLQLVLITGNRNKDGPTSLETTIRKRLRPESLPVVTVSRAKSLGFNARYTADVGIKL